MWYNWLLFGYFLHEPTSNVTTTVLFSFYFAKHTVSLLDKILHSYMCNSALLFSRFNIEPWDSPYGWLTVGMLGLVLGFIGKENPWLWPIGIYLGETLFGLGSFIKVVVFSSGSGANMFIPLGIIFLIPFTIPAFIGSLVGCGIRKVTKAFNN